jgi:hypothetical protein
MIRNFTIGVTLLMLSVDVLSIDVLSVHGASASTLAASDDALDAGLTDDARAAESPAVTAVPAIVRDPRTADLFAVAPAAARPGRCRAGDRQEAAGAEEGA